MQRLAIFTILLLILVFSVAANGQVYKWVDANGKTQYTDQPPPSDAAGNKKKLDIKSAPPLSHANKQSTSTEKEGEDKMHAFSERRTARKETKELKEKEAEALKEQCVHAQGQLKIYRDTPRLRVPDGEGGLVYVDDNVREKRIQEAQKNIAEYC